MNTKQEKAEQIAARLARVMPREAAARLCREMASQMNRPLRWKVAYTQAARILSK